MSKATCIMRHVARKAVERFIGPLIVALVFVTILAGIAAIIKASITWLITRYGETAERILSLGAISALCLVLIVVMVTGLVKAVRQAAECCEDEDAP